MQPEKRTHRIPSELPDVELINKICEGKRGKRENCKQCGVLNLCQYGQEVVKRGLQIVKSA